MSQPGGTDRPPIPHAACSSSRLKGASWSTHSVLGRLRKSFVCLRAHSALKQTLDFETAPGTAGATTQGGEHCLPRQEPGWKRPHATLKAVGLSPLFSRQPEYTADRPAFPLPGGPQGKPVSAAENPADLCLERQCRRVVRRQNRVPRGESPCDRTSAPAGGRAQGRCGTGGPEGQSAPRTAGSAVRRPLGC